MSDQKFEVIPIGTVEASQGQFGVRINEPYVSALEGLDQFSHVNILWWAHQLDDDNSRQEKTCKRPYRKAPDQLGVFATRSPARPNPIALTTVAIISINQNEGLILIPYIDAEHGTPVLDLKPYHPSVERIKQVSLPDWCDHWPKWYEDSASFDWEAEFTFQ